MQGIRKNNYITSNPDLKHSHKYYLILNNFIIIDCMQSNPSSCLVNSTFFWFPCQPAIVQINNDIENKQIPAIMTASMSLIITLGFISVRTMDQIEKCSIQTHFPKALTFKL